MADPDFFRDDEAVPKYVRDEKKIAPSAIDTDKQTDLFKDLDDREPVKPVQVEEKAEKAEKAVEKAEKKAELKRIAALYGEEKYDLPYEAKLKHKVDKDEVEVSIQELLTNYSGKTAWDKKFSELGVEKKKYNDELSAVNKYISEFAEKSKTDKVAGLMVLAEAVGLDPIQYKKQLRSDLLNQYGSYLNMDETQRSIFEQQEELAYLKNLRESEQSRQKTAQAEYARQSQFKAVQETHKIDDERFSSLQHQLINDFKLDVTPENIIELHTATARLDRVDNALKAVNPALLDDLEKVTQLESLLRGSPHMTDKQLSEYANKLYGNEVDKALASLKKPEPKVIRDKTQPDQTFKSRLKSSGSNINFFD